MMNIEELKKLPTGNVADNNTIVGTMDYEIKPVDPTCHLIGRAVTVQCFPGDNLALYQGIAMAGKGDVLVFACHGYTKGGHFGDMMATACKAKGIAGVVIDGTCRDSQDIKELGLPVFARGYCPQGTVKASKGLVNVPVICGNVPVNPGDYIFGDCDGVVVVRQEDAETVFANALKKFDHEAEIRKRLENGEDILRVYGFDKLI